MPDKSRSDMPSKMTKKQLEDRVTELERSNKFLNKQVRDWRELYSDCWKMLQKTNQNQHGTEILNTLTETLETLKHNKKQRQKVNNVMNEIVETALVNTKNSDKLSKHYMKISRKRENTNEENTKTIWETIIKHFNKELKKRDLPNKNHLLKKGEKPRIRRKANELARVENKKIKIYSDDKLGRMLKFQE